MISQADPLSPDVIGRSTVEPDAAGILQAISRIGYQLQEALADLIDNSIDAGASNVLVRFFRDGDRLTDLAVVDDGSGMSGATLEEAMRFGSRTKKGTGDLGKYGMGLKSASLNHADTLSVITRQGGEVCGRRWTTESIQDGWKLETLDPGGATEVLDRDWDVVHPSKSGTLILWERIPRFQAAGRNAGRTFAALTKVITKHLGLVFHRFLESGRLQLFIDLQDVSGNTGLRLHVQPLNPFPPVSGLRGYPADFHTKLGAYGNLEFRGHIWPPKMPDAGYKLGGKVAQRQGFYFFRNDRLIQAGGWNGWRDDAEPHSSLARVEVDLSARFDDAFAISVQKSGVDAPPGFIEALEEARSGRTTLADYVRDAVELYRTAEPAARSQPPVVVKGLRAGLRKRLARELFHETNDGNEPPGVEIQWAAGLSADEVFRVDPTEQTILLNERMRSAILRGAGGSAGDAPVFKTLLFSLVADDAIKDRMTKKVVQRHKFLNACLLAAIEDDR
jgi:hypothetical protein